jgi:hypothetical protein
VNAQELFLDVSSGRFLDGQSTIPISKPTIFSDEQRNLKINVLQVNKNVVSPKQPADDSSFRARLGTTALKLADGQAVSTQPINTIRATATIVTSPASRTVGSARIFTYTPVTANIISSIATFPIVTGVFRLNVDYVAPVTASVTANFAIPVPSIITRPLGYVDSGAGGVNIANSYEFLENQILINPDLAQGLRTTVTATFSSAILGGQVVDLDIVNRGSGYPDGTYGLNIASPTTAGATFTATVSGGVVTTISIVTGGFGYGIGPFNLVFSATTGTPAAATASSLNGSINQITITNGGTDYSTAPSVTLDAPTPGTAAATVVASGGFIQSITITSGGFGYLSAPAVTLFRPTRSLLATGTSIVDLGCKGVNTNTTSLIFSDPDGAETPPTSKRPVASIAYTGEGSLWKITISDVGYGYSATPTVSHDDILAFLPIAKMGFSQGGDVNSWYSRVIDKTIIGGGEFGRMTISPVVGFSETATKINLGGLNIRFGDGSGIFPTMCKFITGGIGQNLAGIFKAFNTTSTEIEKQRGEGGAGIIRYGTQLLNDIGVVVTGSEFDPQQTRVFTPAQNRGGLTGSGNITAEARAAYFPRGTPVFMYGVAIIGQINPQRLLQIPATISTPLVRNTIRNTPDQFASPQHEKFAGKSALVAIVPRNRNFLPTRYAVMEIVIPPRDTSYQVAVVDRGVSGSKFGSQDFGGGRFTPEFRLLDAGAGYPSTYREGFDIVELGALTSDPVIFEYSGATVFTVPATFNLGFIDSPFSQPASITTRPGPASVQYLLGSGGVGYTKSSSIGFQSVQTLGLVRSASLLNAPASYSDGTYSCSVQAPASGTAAQIDLIVSRGGTKSQIVVVNGGSGYTSAPIVTAPAPNFISGQVKSVSVLTQPQGYSIGQSFSLSVPTSPIDGGQAAVLFTQSDSGSVNVVIENPGFGYQTAQVATAPDPDRRLESGFLNTLELQNSPNGYIVGQSYSLQIGQSPQSGGNAVANLIKESESKYVFQMVNAGAGYTSAPIVTAPSPDAPNGLLSSVAITTMGAGYAPGTYEATVGTAPSGGQTAKVNYVVDENLSGEYIIVESGKGYTSAPSISVPTPAGAVISSISITCAGSYYTSDNYSATIQDATGSGARLDVPTIQNGQLQNINVLDKGYGFTDNPAIIFPKPPIPQTPQLQRNQLDLTFNITTASANAILSTATQRDILMEVYETDGTNEQVVAQATVNLAKRVLE